MSGLRKLLAAEFLQWFGLFGAAVTWAAQFLVGYGVTLARCGGVSGHFGVSLVSWEITPMAVAVVLVVLAEAAAIRVLLATRATGHDGPPPAGRRHFFAVAAALGNILFFVVVLLSGIGALTHAPCLQS